MIILLFNQRNFKGVLKFFIYGGQKNRFQQSLILRNFKFEFSNFTKPSAHS